MTYSGLAIAALQVTRMQGPGTTRVIPGTGVTATPLLSTMPSICITGGRDRTERRA